MKSIHLSILITLGFLGLSFPVIWASSNGADPDVSGGWVGGGAQCTTCHFFLPGTGSVELIGAPRRYRPGQIYDLIVRVTDADQVGAGFEISAEDIVGHSGEFFVGDDGSTQNAENGEVINYVTHTRAGFNGSMDQWGVSNSVDYPMQWQAPQIDDQPVTFFVAGNAVDDANAIDGDHYYASYEISQLAQPGDSDGDTDTDLFDYALLQRCFSQAVDSSGDGCSGSDFDGDGFVTLFDAADLSVGVTGPTATDPAGYVLADAVRGALLYDKWWAVNGADEPTGDHPLYPTEIGVKSGSATYRCKECHGWDYKGASGAYGAGSHFTGIPGVFPATGSPQAIFDLLTASDSEMTNGHDMDAAGMSERDVWDVVKMVREATVDTDNFIDASGAFIGTEILGNIWYNNACGSCHEEDGTRINFGTDLDPEHIGGLARRNPWEYFHKTRFGHPGSPMPSLDLWHWDIQKSADIGLFSAVLPD